MAPTPDLKHDHSTRCWWNPDEARWICAFDRRTIPGLDADRPLLDIRDMLVVHTAMLREFRLAPAAVRRVLPGAGRSAAVVDRHLGFLCDMLHHHHEGEDKLLWPLLQQRVPAAARHLVDEAEGQHVQIDAALHAVGSVRAEWLDNPDQNHRDHLAGALEQLHTLLKVHLEHEETAVLPIAARVLTDAEWNAIGDAAAAAMPKPALLLAFGMFAYEGDPVVLRTMLSSAPAVPRLLVPRIGPRVYARRARRVHGSARP